MAYGHHRLRSVLDLFLLRSVPETYAEVPSQSFFIQETLPSHFLTSRRIIP